MHRHGYQGRKLSRDRGPRRALLRAQATSLVLQEQILTTEAKAKEVAPFFERLVTKAKKGDLASQRALRTNLLVENAVVKLITELTPAFADRQGGYTRIVKAGNRRGDNAPMAILALVLPERLADKKPANSAEAEADKKPVESKPSATAKVSSKKEAKA